MFSYEQHQDNKQDFTLEINQMSIPYHSVTSILGMSGHGKTTLLSLLGFLRKPLSGQMEIFIEAENKSYSYKNIWKSESSVTNLRKKYIGFALQRGELAPFLSVIQNIQMPLKLNNYKSSTMNERIKILFDILFPDEKDSITNKMPHDLSGGQYQRVALARALANNPDIILADEPTGTLDIRNSKKVMEHLRQIAHQQKKCVIVVTHNVSLAHRYSDNIYVVGSGKICAHYEQTNFPQISELEDIIDKQFDPDNESDLEK